MNYMIVVLNCQKCDQSLKQHTSQGSLFQGILSVIVIIVLVYYVTIMSVTL